MDMVCMSEGQYQTLLAGVEKLKGWLTYSKTIVTCLQDDNLVLTRENEQLKKQIISDQRAQIFKIDREQKQLTL
jgi:hypothetical protein